MCTHTHACEHTYILTDILQRNCSLEEVSVKSGNPVSSSRSSSPLGQPDLSSHYSVGVEGCAHHVLVKSCSVVTGVSGRIIWQHGQDGLEAVQWPRQGPGSLGRNIQSENNASVQETSRVSDEEPEFLPLE